MKFKMFFISLIVLSCTTMNKSDENRNEICKEQLLLKLEYYVCLMNGHDNVDIEQSIELIRIFNTIAFIDNLDDSLTSEFEKVFFKCGYSEIVAKNTNSKLSKGLVYYSKEYDLYIGGDYHENSTYDVILNCEKE